MLEDWREAKAVAKLGCARTMDFGARFILPSPMIDCIVNSAHHLMLQMIDDLQKETHWSGPSDMPALMRAPVPQAAHPTLQPHPQAQAAASLNSGVASASTSEVRKNRCSACSLSGHNCKL
ncbi:hypothetical protein EDC04DRAFT_2579617 [Pisolithus marmoratus]|nr:hypothetical protein EDC04DRAFT_2579617 [Pisolithus marmoratus]